MGRGWLVCVFAARWGDFFSLPPTNYNEDKAKNKELIINLDIVNEFDLWLINPSVLQRLQLTRILSARLPSTENHVGLRDGGQSRASCVGCI